MKIRKTVSEKIEKDGSRYNYRPSVTIPTVGVLYYDVASRFEPEQHPLDAQNGKQVSALAGKEF